MTVCIAATVLSRFIVTICDRKIGMGGFSADCVMEKNDFIHPSWTAMVAGNDVTHAISIWDKVRKKLGFEVGAKGSPRPAEKTLEEVTQAFVASFQEYRKEQITNQILATHGLTPERLLIEGKKLLGLSVFTDLWNQVAQFKVECEFLVSGFDANKGAHVIGVADPGVCTNYTSLGFWAIGSGQQQALSSIFFSFKDVTTNPNFEGILYDLCAAKFMAEVADGVGAATNVVIYGFGEKPRIYDDVAIEMLRLIWNKSGRPRTPDGIVEAVKNLSAHLHSVEPMQ